MPDPLPSPIAPADTTTPMTEKATGIRPEIALCMSGGGYRAMVFHLGALIRLNEVGLLKKLGRVSSVSGGSITAGVLGLKWKKLAFDAQTGVAANLMKEVIDPVRRLGGETIDADSVIFGILNPFDSISDHIVKAYRKYLFADATLQDLPADGEGPRFVINATNVQTGALWRFSQPFMGDWKIGITPHPKTSLAQAVTASSAFPPILSPVELDLKGCVFEKDPKAPLQTPPYTTKAILSDGGVYDNLGLETAWKHSQTLLVSDAGAAFKPEKNPHSDWTRHSIRVLGLVDNQVRSLRKIALINALAEKDPARKEHDGAYWGINTPFTDFPKAPALSCPPDRAQELAATPTRLERLRDDYMDRLINWGYAISAAALASYYPTPNAPVAKFPYSSGI